MMTEELPNIVEDVLRMPERNDQPKDDDSVEEKEENNKESNEYRVMEEFLRQQEEEDDEVANIAVLAPVPLEAPNPNDAPNVAEPLMPPPLAVPQNKRNWLLTYRPLSFLSFFALIWYALRTRKQYYFAMIYISHSKWAYVVLGNTILALAVTIFDAVIALFFSHGLRIQEAEGLQDFFRWNVTETCLALTMFRHELTVLTAVQFVGIITLKCWHYVASQRERHLRMTEDAIVLSPAARFGFVRAHHLYVLVFFSLLQLVDMYVVQQSIRQLLLTGPSVKILFAFEAAILLVSAWSHIVLWHLHVIDGLIQYGHDVREWYVAQKLLHPWKEYKATLTFAVELQAQAIHFLFYCTFFCIVLTFYGLPINLFREVYVSFMKLKERLTSFIHYRQLMASMNRFRTATEEELQASGRTCIICRDEMTSGTDCKRLPVCAHTFHKSCLREWLVQQQSCPTCRADIAAMEALEASRTAAAAAAAQRATSATEDTTPTDELTADPSDSRDASQLPAQPQDESSLPVPPTSQQKVRFSEPTKDSALSPASQPAFRFAKPAKDTVLDDEPSLIFDDTKPTAHDALSSDIETMPPTMYEVLVPTASVFDGNHAVMRTVPSGTLILCSARRHHDDQVYVRLPEGTWICRENLRSVYEFVVDSSVSESS
jgi:E3 ubiquitin-protein ligase synoviolin